MRRPPALAIPAALFLVALLPTPAGAAGWVTGPPVSPPGKLASQPATALTASGERVVAWLQSTPTPNNGTQTEGIGVRIAAPGGDFGPAQLLGNVNVNDLKLASGRVDDTVALVWTEQNAVHIARRTPGTATFTEVPPFAAGGRVDSSFQVLVQGGDVYVAIVTRSNAGPNVTTTLRVLRLASGATTIEALPRAGGGDVIDSDTFNDDTQPDHVVANPSFAFSGGTLHLVWEDLQDGPTTSTTTIRRSTRPVDAELFTPATPVEVDPVNNNRAVSTTPRVVAAGGHVVVAWARLLQGDLSTLELTGSVGVQRIPAGFPFGLREGIDRTGTAVLAWEEFVRGDNAFGVFGATSAPGQPPSSPQRLTPVNTTQTIDDLVTGPDGDVLVVADRRRDSSFGSFDGRVVASVRPSGGTFGDLEEVSGPHERSTAFAFSQASAALGFGGQAIVGWTAVDGPALQNSALFLSERDATPPQVGGIVIPPAATAEAPVALAASATDALSPVTLTWDFGDGSHARGASVEHVYGAPGTYTITVTARDGAGNVATESRSIPIAAVAGDDGASGGGGGDSVTDRTAPVVTNLKSSNRRFRLGSRGTELIGAGARRSPSGTNFSFTVNERAAVVLSFTGKVPGHRAAGSRCSASRRSGRKCTIAVEPGTLIRASRGPGAVSIAFSGRVGSARLAPGSYRATVTAIDAAGNRSRPVAVSFTVASR